MSWFAPQPLGLGLQANSVPVGLIGTLPASGGIAPGFPGFTSWTATLATLATGISPDPLGGANAARLTEDSSASQAHYMRSSNITITANATYTIEMLVKPGSSGTRNIVIVLTDTTTNQFGAIFNPSTGAFLSSNPTVGGGSVAKTGNAQSRNGYQKIWVTGSVGGNATVVVGQVQFASGTSTTYNGDGTSNLVMWGFNLTAGSSPP